MKIFLCLSVFFFSFWPKRTKKVRSTKRAVQADRCLRLIQIWRVGPFMSFELKNVCPHFNLPYLEQQLPLLRL